MRFGSTGKRKEWEKREEGAENSLRTRYLAGHRQLMLETKIPFYDILVKSAEGRPLPCPGVWSAA